MNRERFGTLPQEEDYSIFDPELLTNKVPWSTPSPVLYGRRDHGTPERPSRFPHGYAAGYDMTMPDSPPMRRQGGYRGRGRSRLIARGDHEMEGENAGGTDRPLDMHTDAEQIEQACALYYQERQRADQLEQEVKNLRKGKKPGR